jgi:hypothetical protein
MQETRSVSLAARACESNVSCLEGAFWGQRGSAISTTNKTADDREEMAMIAKCS